MLEMILAKEDVKEAIANVDKVTALCNYEPSKESHYPKYHSEIAGETANDSIRRICYENIEWRFPGKKGWTKQYEERLEYELGIICKMGYSDYHLIVQDFLGFGRRLGHLSDADLKYLAEHISEMTLDELNEYVNTHQTEVGLTIGPGRGSAVGSLVCYLLGITSIDPIKYDLLFERFLNPERISMPKIYWAFNVNI
jgi:DNA polymerase-3 subunit alpha